MNKAVLFSLVIAASLSGCNASLPTAAEWKQANAYLANKAWGNNNSGYSRNLYTRASRKMIIRNENYEALAGHQMRVGVRWGIKKDCSPRPFSIRVIQRPRYGRVHIKSVHHIVPAASINSRGAATARRCAGLPTIGQAIYYKAPPGRGNYYDYFAIETTTGLRFHYRMLVRKPRG